MKERIKDWLEREVERPDPKAPYLYYSSFGYGVFISFFLIIFQPFNLMEIESQYKFLLIFIYGPITTITILFFYGLIPALSTKFFSKWNKLKESLYTMGMISAISMMNYLYTWLIAPENENRPGLILFFFLTLIIGLFPMVFTALILERKRLKSELKSVEHATDANAGIPELERYILLTPENGKELSIKEDDFLCVKSLGNYCSFYYRINDLVKNDVVRMSMKSAEEQLANQQFVMRTQKSFIVNLKAVNKISGNSRAYRLHIDGLDFEIAVSRNISIETLKESGLRV